MLASQHKSFDSIRDLVTVLFISLVITACGISSSNQVSHRLAPALDIDPTEKQHTKNVQDNQHNSDGKGLDDPSNNPKPATSVSSSQFREPVAGRIWYVAQSAPSGGDGTRVKPYQSINTALSQALPGDAVSLLPGTYSEVVTTKRSGEIGKPIILRSEEMQNRAIISMKGRTFNLNHSYLVVEDLVFDGQYGADDAVRMRGNNVSNTILRRVEIKRSARDCLDMTNQKDVLIENSTIHHCLWWNGSRQDAHAIVGGAVRGLTIRDCVLHTFSGDAVQFDPDRAAPGWDDILIERTKMWVAPFEEETAGFPKGSVPGENAIDTKVSAGPEDPELYRPSLIIRDSVAYGFRGGFISNMAAFNLKEKVNAILERVTVYDSEIALRIRGAGSRPLGAQVTATNILIYDVNVAVRYEDDLRYSIKLQNMTIGADVDKAFVAASVHGTNVIDGRNILVLGGSLPTVRGQLQGLAVSDSAFVDVSSHNYQLARGSPAIDVGTVIESVDFDLIGTPRPQGAGLDVGAYEYFQ